MRACAFVVHKKHYHSGMLEHKQSGKEASWRVQYRWPRGVSFTLAISIDIAILQSYSSTNICSSQGVIQYYPLLELLIGRPKTIRFSCNFFLRSVSSQHVATRRRTAPSRKHTIFCNNIITTTLPSTRSDGDVSLPSCRRRLSRAFCSTQSGPTTFFLHKLRSVILTSLTTQCRSVLNCRTEMHALLAAGATPTAALRCNSLRAVAVEWAGAQRAAAECTTTTVIPTGALQQRFGWRTASKKSQSQQRMAHALARDGVRTPPPPPPPKKSAAAATTNNQLHTIILVIGDKNNTNRKFSTPNTAWQCSTVNRPYRRASTKTAHKACVRQMNTANNKARERVLP